VNCEPVTEHGGSGIRTHGPLRVSGFQDRCIKPLCHPSKAYGDDWRRSVTAKYVIEETGVNGKRKRLFFKKVAKWMRQRLEERSAGETLAWGVSPRYGKKRHQR
jgi:hypothetical protein